MNSVLAGCLASHGRSGLGANCCYGGRRERTHLFERSGGALAGNLVLP